MSLYKKIKDEQIEARKAKDTVKASLLTTLLGEIQTAVTGGLTASQGDPSDADVTKVVKKFVKNTNETIRLKDNETSRTELAVLEQYLPQPLSDFELGELVGKFTKEGVEAGKQGGALVGHVMKQLKEGFADRYDAAKVKGLVESNG